MITKITAKKTKPNKDLNNCKYNDVKENIIYIHNYIFLYQAILGRDSSSDILTKNQNENMNFILNE